MIKIVTIIWQRIRVHPSKNKMLENLRKDILEICQSPVNEMCEDGFVMQLLNCLSGYHPDVLIGYSLNQLASELTNTYIKKVQNRQMRIADARKIVNDLLDEHGVCEAIKEPWLTALYGMWCGIEW